MKSCDERCVVPDSGRAAGLSEVEVPAEILVTTRYWKLPPLVEIAPVGPTTAYPRADPARPCGPGGPGVALRPGVPLRPREELTGRKIAGPQRAVLDVGAGEAGVLYIDALDTVVGDLAAADLFDGVCGRGRLRTSSACESEGDGATGFTATSVVSSLPGRIRQILKSRPMSSTRPANPPTSTPHRRQRSCPLTRTPGCERGATTPN
jgi:hypothetical protein